MLKGTAKGGCERIEIELSVESDAPRENSSVDPVSTPNVFHGKRHIRADPIDEDTFVER